LHPWKIVLNQSILPIFLCNNNDLGLFMDNELILEERITRIRKAVSFAKLENVKAMVAAATGK